MKRLSILLTIFISIFIFSVNVQAAELKNGIYTIESALVSDMVLDVKGGKASSGANIQIYKSNQSNAQKWQVTKLQNGYYKISSIQDESFVFDVKGAGKSNKTNVQLYASNNTNAQMWTIKDAGKGYYYVISKCNNLYLDVAGGEKTNGTNVQMYKGNSTNAQKFKFVEVLEKRKTLDDGNYVISSYLSDTAVIDIKTGDISNRNNVEINKSQNLWSQKWHVQYLNNGYYKISTVIDNQSLDVAGASSEPRTNVQIYNSHNANAQEWIIADSGDGYYYIVSKLGHDNLYLDVTGPSTKSGTNIQVYNPSGSGGQKFKFTKDDSIFLKDGIYNITDLSNNKNISIYNSMITNSVNIFLEEPKDGNMQKWQVKHIKNGYYSISSVFDSNYVLDVAGAGTKSGTNVQLYKSNNTKAQKWYIKYVDGNYVITSGLGNLALDIGEKITEDNNLVVHTTTNDINQQFKFVETEKNDTTPNYPNADISDGYYIIKSSINPNMVFDVSGGYKLNKTNIQLYSLNSTLAQIWHIKKLSSGYYSITSALNRNTSLDVAGGAKDIGTNVQLYKSNQSDAQIWSIKDTGNGNYVIISKGSNLAADISSPNVVNGTNIFMNTVTYSVNQQFMLEPYKNKKTYLGIDVSKWQGDINWEKVAKTNIDFVIIRSGFGENLTKYDDGKFVEYVTNCEKYNIPYAVYFYSYATDAGNTETGAGDEARHALRLLNKIKTSGYSPNLNTKIFYDIEDDSIKGVGKKTLTNIANTFCSTMENNNYKCGIYANVNWLTNYLDSVTLAKKYNIWVASWPKNNTVTNFNTAKTLTPGYTLTNYKYWQFTSKGVLNGISTNVDFDLGYDIFD